MRIEPKPWTRYPWWLRPFFWNQKRKYGAVLDAALLWGRSPKLFAGVALLYGMIERRSSPLDPALRSLVTVLVSQVNHCPFCVDLNSAALLRRGVSAEKISALPDWRTSDLFGAEEFAALDYADAMTRHERGVDEAAFARLTEYFDEDAIIELTGLIAFQNLSSKFNAALAVPAQGFCRLPGPAGDGPSDNAAKPSGKGLPDGH
ncbi:carboxymuconolactone decarboxylase family protein [Actibacterium sp. MT2.3-13A]|uniref:carboxymuconolactone decarboxylase family protein n=1 Tax=Actibacterium sp. MT2.3-13A TaxID=2828332 RepID=UPI001BAAD0CF|nr:carboxymuconolactone decarboxylase family protein [Actibacterium sp. MT2.3-13A]